MKRKRKREKLLHEAIDRAIVGWYCIVVAFALAPVVAVCGLFVAACWVEDWLERGKKWLASDNA